VLNFGVEYLRRKVTFLEEEVGLGKDEVVNVIIRCPLALGMSVENNIAPKVRYLVVDVGLGREGAVKVITRCPQVLGYSVENNIAPTVRYLEEEMGLGKEGAAKVIFKFPSLLGYSVDNNLRPTVEFLAEEAGAGHEGAADIILSSPSLLGLSIERNLRPTLHFLLEKFPGTSGVQAINLSTHSLAGKFVPRVRLPERHGMTGRFSASIIATYTTVKFCEKVGITTEEYDAEVARCKMDHEKRYPSLAGAAADAGAADKVGDWVAVVMDNAIASNKIGAATRHAERRAKLMAAKNSV